MGIISQIVAATIISTTIATATVAPPTQNTSKNFSSYDLDVPCPVIVYHHIVEDNSKVHNNPWITSQDRFEENIIDLKEAGYSFISTNDLYRYQIYGEGIPEKPIIITFDDGYTSNYDLAYPILKKHNVKADIFVVTDMVGEYNIGDYPHFNVQQAREMEKSGLVKIYLHGRTHTDAIKLTREEFLSQIPMGQQFLDDKLGKRDIFAYCYAGGKFTTQTMQDAKDMGADVQLIWRGAEKRSQMKYNFLLRDNISYYTDVVKVADEATQYLNTKIQQR